MSAAVVLLVSDVLHQHLDIDLPEGARAVAPAVLDRIYGHRRVNVGDIQHFVRRLGAYHADILEGLVHHRYRESAVHLRSSNYSGFAHSGLHRRCKQLLHEYSIRAELTQPCRRLERLLAGTHDKILGIQCDSGKKRLRLKWL